MSRWLELNLTKSALPDRKLREQVVLKLERSTLTPQIIVPKGQRLSLKQAELGSSPQQQKGHEAGTTGTISTKGRNLVTLSGKCCTFSLRAFCQVLLVISWHWFHNLAGQAFTSTLLSALTGSGSLASRAEKAFLT